MLASSLLGGDLFGADKLKSLGSGLLGVGGDIVSGGLNKLFGNGAEETAQAKMEAAGKLQEQSIENDIKYQEAKNLASQTNALGMTGAAAAFDAQRAMEKNGPSMEAQSAAASMNAQAQSGLSGAASQANIAKITGQQQTANMLSEARGMSGNPAAAMAVMSKIGQQAGQNNLSALAASNDAISKANALAIGASGQGASLLDESRKTNFSTNIAPHLTQTNATLNTANAAIGAGTAEAMSSAGESDYQIGNPLENMAAMYQGDASGQRAGEQAYGASLLAKSGSQYIPGGNLAPAVEEKAANGNPTMPPEWGNGLWEYGGPGGKRKPLMGKPSYMQTLMGTSIFG